MTFWSNVIGYQAVWFLAVIGAGRGLAWPGISAGLLFVLWQVLFAEQPMAELRLLAVALALGVVIESVLAYSGWARYATPSPALPAHGAPLWILALWASFSMTINRSLSYLRERPWLALLFGAIGAPLAYLGAQRGWHAVTFEAPTARGIAWIAFGWAVAMPMLAMLARRWTSTEAAVIAHDAGAP